METGQAGRLTKRTEREELGGRGLREAKGGGRPLGGGVRGDLLSEGG
jgi:hypothetical protein